MLKGILLVVVLAYSIQGCMNFLNWYEGRIPDSKKYGPPSDKE